MSTARAVLFGFALAVLLFIVAGMVSTSKPARFEPAICPGCEPVPYQTEEPTR